MKSKVLASLAIAGVIALGIGSNAYAKTDAYMVKDNSSSVVYEFEKVELIDAFINYKRNGSDPLYDEYNKLFAANGLYAFHDSTKKYVSFNEVKDAFIAAKRSGQVFKLDDFTEDKGKSMSGMPKTCKRVTVSGDSITYQDKETGSSVTPSEDDLEVISIE